MDCGEGGITSAANAMPGDPGWWSLSPRQSRGSVNLRKPNYFLRNKQRKLIAAYVLTTSCLISGQ
jgi:hypothetical protein